MDKSSWVVVFRVVLLMTALSPAQSKVQKSIVPDLDQRLAKFRRVQMPYRAERLTAREKKLVAKLVDASRYLEDIFWRHMDTEGLDLYQSLADSTNPNDQKL